MTDRDVAEVIRAAFRSREHLVEGAGERLLPAVRVRVRARRRRRALPVAVAGMATAVVLGGLMVVLSIQRSGPDGDRAQAPVAGPDGAPPAGWRLESSLGVEILVPQAWGVNDIGCGMTGKPTVVRGQGVVMACLTPESPTKEVAIIRPLDAPLTGLAERPVSLGDVPAGRAAGRSEDGRYAGWVAVPSKDVAVQVWTRSETTTRAILDSVRLVETDHVGCDVHRPVYARRAGGSDGPFVPPDPTSIGICYYGMHDSESDLLEASARLTGMDARRLAAALNTARPGGNPDRPADQCVAPGPPVADAVLLIGVEARRVASVWVTFSNCSGRGADNGVRRVQVTQSMIALLTDPLHTKPLFGADLPK
jgi:hypothetical protein